MARSRDTKNRTPARRVLILGGARSGKSSCAEALAGRSESAVTMIATAEPFDDEMWARIVAHRRSRPTEWTTIESPLRLAEALARVPSADTAVIDCITVWMGNMFHHGAMEADVHLEVERFITTMSQRRGATYIVSNEVGLGIVPADEMTRTYRDVLGRVNSRLAACVDRAVFMVAGRALELRDVEDIV
jgi:adenosylcobinamide kinase/adenosylcobinamide-phosphate guanylyltransferase